VLRRRRQFCFALTRHSLVQVSKSPLGRTARTGLCDVQACEFSQSAQVTRPFGSTKVSPPREPPNDDEAHRKSAGLALRLLVRRPDYLRVFNLLWITNAGLTM